jgi:hypothetical protein
MLLAALFLLYMSNIYAIEVYRFLSVFRYRYRDVPTHRTRAIFNEFHAFGMGIGYPMPLSGAGPWHPPVGGM